MLIGEKYKIESDTLNVTLFEKRFITGTGRGRPTTKEVGEMYWNPLAYFSSPHNALQYLVKNEIMGDGMSDFQTVCRKLDELTRLINTLRGMSEIGRPRK